VAVIPSPRLQAPNARTKSRCAEELEEKEWRIILEFPDWLFATTLTQEVVNIVNQHEHLQPHLVVHKVLAGHAGPYLFPQSDTELGNGLLRWLLAARCIKAKIYDYMGPTRFQDPENAI
jgi:hypothetical protein